MINGNLSITNTLFYEVAGNSPRPLSSFSRLSILLPNSNCEKRFSPAET
jgi:hypothetical protein